MWVRFKQFFLTAHQELQETSDLIMEDAGMHHANMVRDVVAGLQEVLQQNQVLTENMTAIEAPVNHVASAMQNTQQKFATQLQKIQEMMQTMQLQYAAGPQNAHQEYGGCGLHVGNENYCGQGGRGAQRRGNW